MKSRNLILSLILFVSTILFFQSCATKPQAIVVDPAFREYVSAYTSGMVSRKSAIRIQLNKSVYDKIQTALNENQDEEGENLPDSTILQDIFSIEPAVNGKAVWVSDREIEFRPEEILPSGQLYTVSFELDKVANVKKSEHETFRFQFGTYEQTMFFTQGDLRMYNDYDIDWYYYEGKISTSDVEDSLKLKQTLTATIDGKKLPIRLEKNYYQNEYTFYIDSIKRSKNLGKLEINWDGTPINAKSIGQTTVDVPAYGDFSISEAKVVDRDDQKVELTFTEPLLYGQNLNGIITLEGVENLTYKIENNKVTVFLPNRYLGEKRLDVSSGIKNIKGYNMNYPYEDMLTFYEAKPLVKIKGNGSILPNSQGLIFPFEAISLRKVDVRIIKIYENNIHNYLQVNELNGDDGLTRFGKIVKEKTISLDYDDKDLKKWNSHVIDLNDLIKAELGAIYRVSIRFKKEYAICNCEEENENDQASIDNQTSYGSSNESEDAGWTEKFWHGYNFDEYNTWDYYEEEYSACSDDYYYGKAVSRNILASDLGLIYKMEENKLSHAFVNDMLTTKPISNVEVEYFDFTKQLIASGRTDANGMLEIKLKEKPFLMVAKYGKQRGYLKLADGYSNSLSKFDVKGELVQKGVKGYIYGERGVWRPGDSLYLNFILENKDKLLPENHPVSFELFNPNGQVVYKTTKTKNLNGLYDFHCKTSDEAPTGNYTAEVKVGNKSFTKILKIESVKPNRLKIELDMDENSMLDSVTTLSSKWLHGALAKNLRASVNVKVSRGNTKFDKFKNYEFDSPIRDYVSEEENVFNGTLNDKGEAKIKTKLQIGKNAPGMLRATFITKVFEKGGDFSIDRMTVKYSPFRTYIGLDAPEFADKQQESYETDKNYKFNVVSINEKQNFVSAKELNVKIYKISWRWWYEKDQEDFANYISRSGTIVVKDTLISTENGKGTFNFKINYPDYGRYIVTVTDVNGKHQTGKIISVDWPAWNRANRGNNENANMLQFSTDKEKYQTGEQIKLSFPSPSNGRALVSIENRSKVLKKFWIETQKGETTYSIEATKEMAPNAYIHVTLLQAHIGTKNDLPIRMYGVLPLLVDNPNTHLYPEISCAEVFKPETTANIKVSEKNGKRMTYTLAIVDDGLLDLTRFQTPAPWDAFYAKEALGVKTWDMYDDVIGAYAGKLNKLLSIGGDGEIAPGKGAKANRFKPMVRHIGPFVLEAGQSKTHQVEIPNYVGSVRVMVVAQDEGAYGNVEKTVSVKKALMILPSLPRVLGPSEEIYLPVNVFAMEKHIKDVKISIEVNGLLTNIGNKVESLSFSEIGDDIVNFKLKVADRIGIAKIKIIATSGNETAIDEIEVDVRPSNPVVYDVENKTIESGKELNGELAFTGLMGTNLSTVEVSSIPALGLEKRLSYLIEYPHGCIEQTTSGAFPQLFVSNLMHVSEKEQASISKNIKAAIRRIQLFQRSSGGFSYWPGESDESEWGTNYAGHFLLESEKQGYSLPSSLKDRWIKYQQKQAKNWSSSSNFYTHSHAKESHELVQAYRLYTLALSNNPELGAMNRLREETDLSQIAKWRLAGAYLLAGQEEVAAKLIFNLPATAPPYKEMSYTYGSDKRDKAMILEVLSLFKNTAKGQKVADELSGQLNNNSWMSTQETAYSLLAIASFYGVKGISSSKMEFSYSLNGQKEVQKSGESKLVKLTFTENDYSSKAKLKLKNNGKTKLFVKITNQGIPLIGDEKNQANNLNLKVLYKDSQGNDIDVTKIKQGNEFFAEVTVTNPGKKGFYKEMVINQIFPSGWEIHNSRMDESSDKNEARYQDIRDDRVYTYYDIPANSSKKFKIRLNASYLGKFYLPSVYSEAMYDHGINAKVGGKWVEVVKS
ncbi:MAG: MG2 domain-containing protein [Bacteroidota bacterium]